MLMLLGVDKQSNQFRTLQIDGIDGIWYILRRQGVPPPGCLPGLRGKVAQVLRCLGIFLPTS
jgi:hypothetical protein